MEQLLIHINSDLKFKLKLISLKKGIAIKDIVAELIASFVEKNQDLIN